MSRRLLAFTLSLIFGASVLTLGGCGVKGDLQTPPPLWGDQDKPEKPEGENKD